MSANWRMVLAGGRTKTQLHTYEDVRRASRRRVPRMVFDFVDGGADGEVTLRANRSAFEAVRFDPRWLSDVSGRDASTTVLGLPVSVPFLLAPAGLATLVHPDGELAAARAAGRAGIVFTASIASGRSLEEIAEVATGPLWFQLYLWRSEEVVAGLIDRAKAAGYHALVLTIDVPAVGKRERDLRNGMSLPPRIRVGSALEAAVRWRWLRGFLTGPPITFANLVGIAPGDEATTIGAYVERELVDPAATWERVDWIRRRWDGPLVIKGVLSVRDATEAVRRGADAVYVSNHGGRQLDSVLPTAEALPRVAEAVGERAEVLVDGGVRRGEDIVKARALGARACLGGRPWFHALAAGGEDAVARMVEILRTDTERTLALVGVPRIEDVDASILAR